MSVQVRPGFDHRRWAGLGPALTLQHDPDWLGVMASRLPGQVYTIVDEGRVGFLGVVVEDRDAYEAYNPFQLLWRDPPVFDVAATAHRRRVLAGLADPLADTLPALVLVAPGYRGDPAGPAGTDTPALAAVLLELRDWCAGAGLAGLHAMYATSPELAKAVAELGGATYPMTARAVLPVWWSDWAGYLAALPARRGKEISRELRRAGEAGVAPVALDPSEYFDALLAGRCELLRWYGQAADEAAERTRLAALLDRFGERVRAHAAVHRGEVVASAVSIQQGRAMTVVYCGATQAGRRLPYAHFTATFYAVVRDTTSESLDEIDYGIGHTLGKTLRGCRLQALHAHAIGTTPQRQRLLDFAASLLGPPAAPGSSG